MSMTSRSRSFAVWAGVWTLGAATVYGFLRYLWVVPMMTSRRGIDGDATHRTVVKAHDPDGRKGAMEDGIPWTTTNAPGLDDDGLPNDETAIAEHALGARTDESQG